MKFHKLGRTGQDISVICLGTMTFGEQNSQADGFEQMDYALEQGVNFFDTAELYSVPPRAETTGSTERIIGEWFSARGTRNKVILASKVAGAGAFAFMRDKQEPTRLNRAQMTEALDKSLKRLRTDHIDLYQIHWPERPMQWGSNPTSFHVTTHDETTSVAQQLDVLDGFVRAGKVRWLGLSNESAWGAMSFLKESDTRGLARMQSVQNAYSLINRTFETALAEVAMREQLGLLAYSPLAQGYPPANTKMARCPRDRARPCSTACNATRNRAPISPSMPIWLWHESMGSTPPRWRSHSSIRGPSLRPTSSAQRRCYSCGRPLPRSMSMSPPI